MGFMASPKELPVVWEASLCLRLSVHWALLRKLLMALAQLRSIWNLDTLKPGAVQQGESYLSQNNILSQ